MPILNSKSKQQTSGGGVLPGFNDEDCERPSCDDIKTVLKTSLDKLDKMPKSKAEKAAATPSVKDVQCPIGKGDLGTSSWKLLHTMAAWYPDKPTKEQQSKMKNFMTALAEFYPCTWCAHDFQDNIDKEPVKASSRTELCQWLCEQHNHVNAKLGKPLFDCNLKNLDERWRKSSNPKCQSGGH